MRWRLLFAILLFVACQDEEPAPSKPQEAPPQLSLSPEPGVFYVGELLVKVSAPSDEFALWFGVNEDPDPNMSAYYGAFEIKLNHSAEVRVLVADSRGRIWGPLSYRYTLQNGRAAAECEVVTERALVNGSQTVEVTVGYFPATEVDRFYLSHDATTREVNRDELDNDGYLKLTAGPWPNGGVHAIGCHIEGPRPHSHSAEISVDVTPPSAGWTGSAGSFTRSDWPVGLSLWAADSLSGLAEVQICSPNGCVSAYGIGGGIFQHATAFTAGTHFHTTITAAVRDQVDNVTVLAPIAFDIDFDEAPGLPPSPISATVSTVVSLYDHLPENVVVDEVRKRQDFATSQAPGALALTPGWNDFLFRQAGKTDWESFAVYHLGFKAMLPPGPETWLVYASNATLAAVNGAKLGAFSGDVYFADWWDIPHVWFVRDADGDGAWSDGDALCAPGDDMFTGAWARRAVPWVWQAQTGDCTTATAPAPDVAYLVACNDCSADGRLFMESRAQLGDWPAFHGFDTGASAAGLQIGAAVSFPTANAPLCLFFWDENGNDAIDGREPRDFDMCDAPGFELVRRNGPLRSRVLGDALIVEGLAYGGTGWVTLEVMTGSEVLTRRSLGPVFDADGIGKATLAIPTDTAPVLPWFARVTDSVSAAPLTALPPKAGAAPAEWLEVVILNDYGLPFTAGAAIVLNTAGETAGGVYGGDGQPVMLGVNTPGAQWSGMAVRDGYLSVVASASVTEVTLYLLSPLSTGLLEGQVVDFLDRPVPFANVTWSAPPYQSQTVADGEGRFSIPALGAGGLWADGALPGQTVSQFFVLSAESYLNAVTMRLPGGQVALGRGLVGDASFLSITGAEPADAVLLPPYYYASLADGVWMQGVGGVERRFVYPGYLPSHEALPAVPVATPRSVGEGLAQYVACGDRLQQTGTSGTILVDAPCWRWYAETSLETYFLGFIDIFTVADDAERFGTLHLDVINGHGNSVVLTDQLFGRALHVPLVGSSADGAVAVGTYSVALSDGTPLLGDNGKPAFVTVVPRASVSYTVVKP